MIEDALTGLIPPARVKVGMPVSVYGHEGSSRREVSLAKEERHSKAGRKEGKQELGKAGLQSKENPDRRRSLLQ